MASTRTQDDSPRRHRRVSVGSRHRTVAEDERAGLIKYRVWAEKKPNVPSFSTLIARAIAAHDNAKPPHNVAEGIDARQDNADRRNLSDRHRADLKSRLKQFREDFGSRQIADVSMREVEACSTGSTIELPPEVTKTNRRRTCDIPPCAVAWLKPLAGLPESPLGLTESEYRKHLAAAAKAAGITWEENLLRHSFGTFLDTGAK